MFCDLTDMYSGCSGEQLCQKPACSGYARSSHEIKHLVFHRPELSDVSFTRTVGDGEMLHHASTMSLYLVSGTSSEPESQWRNTWFWMLAPCDVTKGRDTSIGTATSRLSVSLQTQWRTKHQFYQGEGWRAASWKTHSKMLRKALKYETIWSWFKSISNLADCKSQESFFKSWRAEQIKIKIRLS